MRVILALCSLLLAAVPAHAEEASIPAADRAQIRTVIERQIEAFAKDDAAAAFAFASPAIQRKFGTADDFMAMVRSGYAAVYRPRSLSFGEARLVGEVTVQQVDVIGPDGIGRHAFYLMEHEGDGSWRINGVTMTRGAEEET